MSDDVLQPESSPAMPLRRFAHEAMACTFEVALLCDDARYAQQAAHAAFAEIDRLDCDLSRYIPTSDVSRINALQPGQTLQIGADALECLRLAEQLCRDTGGAFDVTYASKITDDPKSEHSTAVTKPRALLELDPDHRRVRVHAVGVRVDLGGIGKGFAVDRALEVLREWSISAGLIHSGQSSLLAFGSPESEKSWRIALRDPLDPAKVHEHIELKDAALSGSGRKLHGDHIIDPRTSQPAVTKIAAWSVAPSAAQADALSTAFMIMSPEEISAYCRAHDNVYACIAIQEADQIRQRTWGDTKWKTSND